MDGRTLTVRIPETRQPGAEKAIPRTQLGSLSQGPGILSLVERSSLEREMSFEAQTLFFRTVLDLQKNGNDSTLHPVSPMDNALALVRCLCHNECAGVEVFL